MRLSRRQIVLRDEFHLALDLAKPRTIRPICQFAEEEIVVPGGPREGQLFSMDDQPSICLLLRLIDEGVYRRYAVTGPLQSGKTFLFVIAAMWHLFEVGENVVYGIPQMEMAMDKWNQDFLPVIQASRYRDLLPDKGQGSEGGKFESMTFKNGRTLKFMSAHGSDAKRSGFTTRVLIMTEIDKYDEASEKSREGDPVTQMIGRLEAFDLMTALIYMESSASIPTGRIWREYTSGSEATIMTPCPHCAEHVCMERENLKGWHDCADELTAREMGRLVCPNCSAAWSEDDRHAANRRAVLCHRGQTVLPDGTIVGDPPRTLTAGFRWNATNSLLKPVADISWKEWRARFDPDQDNSEKTVLQFTWAKPWSGETNASGISADIVASRVSGHEHLVIPEDTEVLVCHVDMHIKWHCWVIVAAGRMINPAWSTFQKENPGLTGFLPNGRPIPKYLAPHYTIVDYGLMHTPDRAEFGVDSAMRRGLDEVTEEIESRQYVTNEGREIDIDLGLIDVGYKQELVLEFLQENVNGIWRPVKGKGSRTSTGESYRQPKVASQTERPGHQWYESLQAACPESGGRPWWLYLANTDWWTGAVHSGFMAAPWIDQDHSANPDDRQRRPGSIALFGDDANMHLRQVDSAVYGSSYASQIVGWIWADMKSKKNKQRVGWNKQHDRDHFLDNTYNCLVGSSIVYTYAQRFRPQVPAATGEPSKGIIGLDGRPYLISERDN